MRRSQINKLVKSVGDDPCPAHAALADVTRMVLCGVAPILVGPGGCGKSSMCARLAEVLELPFYYTRAVRDEYSLIGFRDAHGRVVRTAFREAFEHGGIFLMDEMDAGSPNALLAFNEAFANGRCDFPDGVISAHADFHVVAAANTHGTGRDRQYVGRNQLDATTLDRFCVIEVDYDRELEKLIPSPKSWRAQVWSARQAVSDLGIRHIVSTRAIVAGARLLRGGFDRSFVEKSVLWRGLPQDQIDKIVAKMEPWIEEPDVGMFVNGVEPAPEPVKPAPFPEPDGEEDGEEAVELGEDADFDGFQPKRDPKTKRQPVEDDGLDALMDKWAKDASFTTPKSRRGSTPGVSKAKALISGGKRPNAKTRRQRYEA